MSASTHYPPTIAAEIGWLYTLPDRNLVDGAAICYAYGSFRTDVLLDNEPLDPDWPFDITYDRAGQRLRLCIDTYQHDPGNEFDDEAWLDGLLHIDCQPACRANYRLLQRAARALLAGYTVQIGDETLNLEQWRAQS